MNINLVNCPISGGRLVKQLSSRYNLGQLYSKQGDSNACISLFSEALDAYPDQARLAYGLGRCYYKTGDYAATERYLKRAQELDPYSPDPHFGLALVYAQLGRHKEAQTEAQKVYDLSTDPEQTLKIMTALWAIQEGLEVELTDF